MKLHAGVLAFALCTGSAIAQPATAPTPDSLVATAKKAAGLDYAGTFMRICIAPDNLGARGPGRGAGPRPTPARATWYAAPYKVFDNLFFVGTQIHSSWALTTSQGIIIIDTLYDYAAEPEIVEGLTRLGLDPRNVKYVIISHAHGDHDQGAAELQSKYGAHVVMGAPDWEATLKRAPGVAGGVPRRGPGDITVGPEGKKLTVGDTTIDIVFTPGHTVGTLSYVFPVKDKGKTVMVAYSGGTLTGAFGADARRWDGYIDSQKRIAAAARAANASVILSNHSEYDDAYTKARLVTAKREVGEDNPFVVGPQRVQNYFTVMEECATASKLRNGAK
jgi:metallo-beta-lactamase class B